MSADHAARQTTVRTPGERPARAWTGADSARLRLRIQALVNDLMRGVLDAFVMASPTEIVELMRVVGHSRDWDGTSWRFERVAKAMNGAVRPASLESSKAEVPPVAPPGRDTRSGAEESGRPLRRNAAQRALARDSKQQRVQSMDRIEEAGREPRSSLGTHDPFDITSPGELLASAGSGTSSGEALDRIAMNFDRVTAAAGRAAPAAPPTTPVADASKPADSLPAPPAAPTPADGAIAPVDRETASERRPRVVLREGERLLSATGSGVVIRRARR